MSIVDFNIQCLTKYVTNAGSIQILPQNQNRELSSFEIPVTKFFGEKMSLAMLS